MTGVVGARRYVVVSGPPASGKSTLAAALAAELGYPLVAKDTIKEALMARLGAPDVEASRRLGGAAVAAVLAVAQDCPAAVLESVWHRSRAAADLAALGAPLVEVFCRCERSVAQARYEARAGTRAAGHFDRDRLSDELWNDENTVPVAGGWPVLEVDTTGPVEVAAVTARVRDALRSAAGSVVAREAEAADGPALAALHHATVTAAYAGIFPRDAPMPDVVELAAQWAEALAESGAVVLVAEAYGVVVGSVAIRPDADHLGRAQLRRLHVLPGWWGVGLGSRLHDEALARMSAGSYADASLWVLEANTRARAMYERRGWRLVPRDLLEWPGLDVLEVRYEREL